MHVLFDIIDRQHRARYNGTCVVQFSLDVYIGSFKEDILGLICSIADDFERFQFADVLLCVRDAKCLLCIGNKQIINLLKGYIKASVGGTFGAVQDAAIYALLNSQSERKELRNLYKSRRDLAYSLLKAAGFDVVDSEGTFFLWFKLPKRFSDDVSFVDSLLFEKQVALIPGSTFGKNGEGYLRLSLVSDLGYIEEGIRRLINFVNENG